jgi:hypothetical protein
MGGGKNNMHGSSTIDQTSNLQCTNLFLPQAVGEDMVKTCWRDSDFCSNCRAWNIVHMFKVQFNLLHVAIVHHQCWGSTARRIIWLFLAIFNGIYPSANSFTCRSIVSLNLSSTTCNILEHCYPTKHNIFQWSHICPWETSSNLSQSITKQYWHHTGSAPSSQQQ